VGFLLEKIDIRPLLIYNVGTQEKEDIMTTGSVFNNLMQDSLHPTPEVGMGATLLSWTDRTAATIVEVNKSGKKIKIREDKSTRTDSNGMSDSQAYTYEPNPNGSTREYSLRKNGRWVRVGQPQTGSSLLVGHREEYYDYSF